MPSATSARMIYSPTIISDMYRLSTSAITGERVQCQRNWRTYWTALLENRAAIGSKLMKLTSTKATELGLKLTFADVKDMMFPGEMKKVFAQVVEAQKEGQAALEKARGETAALRNLANAARITDDNPNLLQLRALQAFADSTGNTLVFGLPGASILLARPPDKRGTRQPEKEDQEQ
jgi:hypothetical protein